MVGAGDAAQGRQHCAARAHLQPKGALLQGGATVAGWDGMGGVWALAVDGAGQESGLARRRAGHHDNRRVRHNNHGKQLRCWGHAYAPSAQAAPWHSSRSQHAQRGGCARRGWSPPGSPSRLQAADTDRSSHSKRPSQSQPADVCMWQAQTNALPPSRGPQSSGSSRSHAAPALD